jgi:predicted Rossmann fold flavoprotein
VSKSVVIIGGGAAGFFTAINVAQMNPSLKVQILEKSNQLLGKVKISGGGRCNVTHACFEPRELIKYYPRGSKEMLGPFHTFQPGDTYEWFERRGVSLKAEEDGRVFPVTDNSQTIIDCFMKEAADTGVKINMQQGVSGLKQVEEQWQLTLSTGETILTDYVVFATGSSTTVWNLLKELGHSIVEPVPSLFTFNIKDNRIKDLAGVAGTSCEVRIEGTKYLAEGPVLVTHWGLSGPGILKLSSRAARELAEVKYDFNIRVNWDSRFPKEDVMENLREWKLEHSKQQVKTHSPVKIPHRLWLGLLSGKAEIQDLNWADLSNKQMEFIHESICECYFRVSGKSTFKEEFVTCGGVSLKEVDFKYMSSRLLPNIYFTGEVLDIDAVTGGFNFQAAWTTSYIVANAITQRVKMAK